MNFAAMTRKEKIENDSKYTGDSTRNRKAKVYAVGIISSLKDEKSSEKRWKKILSLVKKFKGLGSNILNSKKKNPLNRIQKRISDILDTGV